jgi:hypothetical protein
VSSISSSFLAVSTSSQKQTFPGGTITGECYMKIAEIFSLGGCGGRGHGGSERHYRHGDYYRSSYREHYGERYDRHDRGGLLGILGGY